MGGGSYTIRRGDTLSGIAQTTYGNAALWQEIRNANPDKVHGGGDRIAVDDVLALPELDVDRSGRLVQGAEGGGAPAVAPVLKSTDFGVFEVYPDDPVGALPPTADGIQVVRASTLERYRAEAATDIVNPEIDALEEEVSFGRTVVTVAGEQVAVTSKAEAQHARRIQKTLRETYGIQVDSASGVDAIKARYSRVPDTELDKLKTREWEYKELVALERALAHFAPVLGAQRAESTLAGADQEVTSVSKVDQAIDRNSPRGTLDTDTLGEYFEEAGNFSMFTAGTDKTVEFSSNDKELEGTAVHEMAHGLMSSYQADFVASMDYWTDEYTASGKAGAEAPPTGYGQTNAGEDLSETVMYFFVEPAALASKCPARYAWTRRVVDSWATTTASP